MMIHEIIKGITREAPANAASEGSMRTLGDVLSGLAQLQGMNSEGVEQTSQKNLTSPSGEAPEMLQSISGLSKERRNTGSNTRSWRNYVAFEVGTPPKVGRGMAFSKGCCPVDESIMMRLRSNNISMHSAQRVPDISEGLGKRQESKDIVALGDFVASQAIWMKYDGVLCLYHPPCWRKLENENAAIREIRTMLYEYDDIRDSLTASDYHRLYRGLMSHPDIPELSNLEPPRDTINCNDGALNLISFQAHLPCPEDNFFHAFDLSCEQILDPPMRGSYFEMFVDQISAGNPDVRRQLLEMLAIAMTGTQLKYFYVMLGPSNSGKSQWGRFVQELLGRENVESVQSIADFGGRFTTGSLCGKLLASCLDLPNGTLPQNAIGVLKTFCGDDSVKGEVKYKQSFTYYRKPLLMMAGNHSIKVNRAEHEDALFNRMIVVPFADPNVEESERIPELYQRFLDEAPYIVHEACMAYQELAARNWVPTRVPVPAEYAPQEGNQALLAAKAFVEDCISFETGSQVTTAELYDAYLEYAEEEGYPQLNMTSFSRALSKMLKQAIPEAATVKRVNDENVRGYSNITLT